MTCERSRKKRFDNNLTLSSVRVANTKECFLADSETHKNERIEEIKSLNYNDLEVLVF